MPTPPRKCGTVVTTLEHLQPRFGNADAFQSAAEWFSLNLRANGYCIIKLDANKAMQLRQARHGVFRGLSVTNGELCAPGLCVKRLQRRAVIELTGQVTRATASMLDSSFLQQALQSAQLLDDIARAGLCALGHHAGFRTHELPNQLLDDPINSESSVMQGIMYKPATDEIEAQGWAELDTHEDRGLLTVVSCVGPGFQAMNPRSRTWQPVELADDEVLVFAGHTLQHLTAGDVPALIHRVVGPTVGQPPRQSLTYKLRARPDAVLDAAAYAQGSPSPGATNGRPTHPPLTAAQLMQQFDQTHAGSINNQPNPPTPTPHPTPTHPTSRGGGAAVDGQPARRPARQQPQGAALLAAPITVLVMTQTGKKITVQADLHGTVEQLKMKVEDKEGVPVSQQQLLYAGRQLEDERTLGSYNLYDQAVVDLVLKLRGD